MTPTTTDRRPGAARTDLAWLEARQRRWVAECEAKHRPRDPGDLARGHREMAPALERLERLLEDQR